jgi:hypothetical protein
MKSTLCKTEEAISKFRKNMVADITSPTAKRDGGMQKKGDSHHSSLFAFRGALAPNP